MKILKYVDADGQAQEITVADKVFDTIEKMNKREELDERRETRRCQSLESSIDNGFDVADPNADVEEIVYRNERYKKLYFAISKLLPEQQELIAAVYFDGKTKTEMSERFGISRSAISKRIARILAQLKKFLI